MATVIITLGQFGSLADAERVASGLREAPFISYDSPEGERFNFTVSDITVEGND